MNRFAERYYTADEKEGLLRRAQGYYELGMYKDAIEECRKLILIDPNNPDRFIDLGSYCEDNGQVHKAIRYYKYAIKKFPNDSRFYANLGYCYGKYRKRDDIEMICCEKALEIDPYNEWALNNIASILERKGSRKESLLYYEKAYEACKHNYGSVCDHIAHNFAWALYRCRKYARAWLIYSYLVDKCPDKFHVICDFGRVNYKIGAYGKALDYFGRALAINPSRRYRRLYRVACNKTNQ